MRKRKSPPAPRVAAKHHGGARPRSKRPRTHQVKRAEPRLTKGEFSRDVDDDRRRGDKHLNHSVSIAESIADLAAFAEEE